VLYDISTQTKESHTLVAVFWFRKTSYFVLVGGCRPFARTDDLLELEMADSFKITGCRKMNLMALEL
jgi:hypothetical protein